MAATPRRACLDCVIRNNVTAAMAGIETCDKPYRAELRTGTGARRIDLLVSASRLPDTKPPLVMLILEGLPRSLPQYPPTLVPWHQTETGSCEIRP
jgi:hypothetical protein